MSSSRTTSNEDVMEKGELKVQVEAAAFDPLDLQPRRPQDVTNEDFKLPQPDEKGQQFLEYLKSLKSNKSMTDNLVQSVELSMEGYPRLATVIDSDEQFMLYRRFGYLQARLLLHKQDELRAMEDRLFRMDEIYGKHDPERLRSRARNNVKSKDQKNLLDAVELKFKEYAQLLSICQNLAESDRPAMVDYIRVKSYFDDQQPLCNSEQAYIYRKEDLITLKPSRENTWLDSVVEKIPQRFPCRLTRKIFCPPELRKKTNPDATNLILFSPERINIVVSLIILITVLALLIVPVYILWRLSNIPSSESIIGILIAILLLFTLIFSAVLSLFTRAKRHEVLAAAAAYCAVLVVFVGNVGSLSPTQA